MLVDRSRRPRRFSAVAVCAAALVLMGAYPNASAAPGQLIDMNLACSMMYPGNADFRPATAYQVAPRDAYSWRCQRTSTSPNGGIITDLSADPNAVCPARVSPSNPPQWECTA